MTVGRKYMLLHSAAWKYTPWRMVQSQEEATRHLHIGLMSFLVPHLRNKLISETFPAFLLTLEYSTECIVLWKSSPATLKQTAQRWSET